MYRLKSNSLSIRALNVETCQTERDCVYYIIVETYDFRDYTNTYVISGVTNWELAKNSAV